MGLIVHIEATVEDVRQWDSARGAEPHSETTRFTASLAPEAKNHPQAVVRALRHGSDVAASRFDAMEEMHAPPNIERLINEMAAFDGGTQGSKAWQWAARLAAEYGMLLREPCTCGPDVGCSECA